MNTIPMRLYLVQRGKLHAGEHFERFTGSKDNAFVELDYMGAAEFEWGAIPKAYRRIFDKFDEFELIKTDLVTNEGKFFYLFCKKDRYEDTLACIKEYIENPYTLHEYSHLSEHFKKQVDNFSWSNNYKKTDFWWDIVNDWIGFLAGGEKCGKRKNKIKDGTGKANAFKEILKKHFQELWLDKTSEEREDMRKTIYRNW